MKSITIKGSKRTELGKSSSKKLRNEDKVPCILYGAGEPIHFYSNEIDFKKLVYTPDAHTVNIELGEKNQFNAIMQDIQFHPVTDRILHIDFYQLSDDKEVSIDIPVRLEGQAPGVLNSGGTLARNKSKLKVRALPKNLPDFPILLIWSGVAIATSKSCQPFSIFFTISSSDIKSAPASLAETAASPSANTSTLTCFPVP